MRQQSALARCADASDLVQRVGHRGLGPLGAMRPDCPAMRLVPQALDEIQYRIVHTQGKGTLAGAVEFLFPVVAVLALGDADHRNILDPQIGHDLMHRRNLPRPAVDQQKIGPTVGLTVGVLFEQA